RFGVLGLGCNQDRLQARLQSIRRHRAHGNPHIAANAIDEQSVAVHRCDMIGPLIDQHHVVAGLRHRGAGEAADCAGADDGDLHVPPPTIRVWPETPPAPSPAKTMPASPPPRARPRRRWAMPRRAPPRPASPISRSLPIAYSLQGMKLGATLLTVMPNGPSS